MLVESELGTLGLHMLVDMIEKKKKKKRDEVLCVEKKRETK